ncbi:MAG: sigma-70 family RNA polymerase sigma factor, partial [bacterium]|nr:sigma-70 family RNA polymerase sigma factor [bacterium]
FYTWLYRIGVNCCLDWLKSPNRRINDLSLERERWEGREDRGRIQFRSTDEGVEQRELQAILESALEALPDDYRVVVVMREFDGLTYEEIAHFMHCNIGTVKSRLFRARTRLREIMKIDYKAWFGA